MKKRTFRICLVCLILAAISITALGAAHAGGSLPAIDWWVFGSGGGRASDGGSVTLDSTLGQPVAGVSTSSSAWLGAGYWYADQPVQIFLPMLRR